MNRRSYPTDLTDAQWERLRPLLETDPSKGGAPRTYALREIVNGLLYQLRGGIAWRAMPHDLPPWDNIYNHFRRRKQNGKFELIHDALRAEVRVQDGRVPTPSAVIIDSLSVKTAGKGGSVASMAANS